MAHTEKKKKEKAVLIYIRLRYLSHNGALEQFRARLAFTLAVVKLSVRYAARMTLL